MRQASLLAILAALSGIASLVAAGPVPGDVTITRALQSLFGDAPGWAVVLTQTAKAPLLWGTLVAGAALAGLAGGWRVTVAVPLAYGFAWLANKALRAVLFVPKPDADLVAVASASAASGLPSTFGLVYASLFGVVFWVQRESRAIVAARLAAVALILTGSAARIVLGGHWTSQMIASVCVGVLLAGLATFAFRPFSPRPLET
jgi:membrane-associated phospholipid phosphatase